MSFDIEIYIAPSGKKPYVEWETNLPKNIRAIVTARLGRLRGGNFGDCKPLVNAKGIYEMRIHIGPGYRIYYGKKKHAIVLLLCGGQKSTQSKDLKKAKEYWLDYLDQGERK
ncbi:MAG: type II toxin-antitoxin system RelE/ParE family toxin [Chlamydiales bacterium]